MIKAYNNIPSYETEIKSSSRIFIAGHNGMVGSAMVRKLKNSGYNNLILANRDELDLLSQNSVKSFYEQFRPEHVIVCAAKVGGIRANNIYRAQFIYENIQIQANLIHFAYVFGVKKLLFLVQVAFIHVIAHNP